MSEKKHAYAGDGITVFFEPRLCLHSARCLQLLPAVFDNGRKPWVNPAGTEPDTVAAVIHRCPTGALTYERADGGALEAPSDPVHVTVERGGPLYVRGALELRAPDGTVVRRMNRAALCRCGQSKRKPFCDNTHREIGFDG